MSQEETRRRSKREQLLVLLAKIYWNDTAPYSERAVKAAALFLEVTDEQAKAELEKREFD